MPGKRVGILVGGGPAPGTNGVVAAAAIEAIHVGWRPVGFHDGFEWLAQRYTDEQHELTLDEVSHIHLQGGVLLGTSRTDVSRDPAKLENAVTALRKLAIEALVTVGGDDLVASTLAVARHAKGAIRIVQVPKSIDNDLPLPGTVMTLGFETARHVGVNLVKSLMEDARTTGRWYLAVTMGRPTGNLTLGIGKAASTTCTVIPEEFGSPVIKLADIADIVEGVIIKRRALGRKYGVVLLAEALVEHFGPKEVAELETVDRDAQGNIRVTEVNLGRRVKNAVQTRLERRGISVTIVDKTIGYELRCATPLPYDAECARDLGYAAIRHLMGGGSGDLITIQAGRVRPLPLASLVDATIGRGRPRFVDVRSEAYEVARAYMVRLEPRDFVDEAWVCKLEAAGALGPGELRRRFGAMALAPGSG